MGGFGGVYVFAIEGGYRPQDADESITQAQAEKGGTAARCWPRPPAHGDRAEAHCRWGAGGHGCAGAHGVLPDVIGGEVPACFCEIMLVYRLPGSTLESHKSGAVVHNTKSCEQMSVVHVFLL